VKGQKAIMKRTRPARWVAQFVGERNDRGPRGAVAAAGVLRHGEKGGQFEQHGDDGAGRDGEQESAPGSGAEGEVVPQHRPRDHRAGQQEGHGVDGPHAESRDDAETRAPQQGGEDAGGGQAGEGPEEEREARFVELVHEADLAVLPGQHRVEQSGGEGEPRGQAEEVARHQEGEPSADEALQQREEAEREPGGQAQEEGLGAVDPRGAGFARDPAHGGKQLRVQHAVDAARQPHGVGHLLVGLVVQVQVGVRAENPRLRREPDGPEQQDDEGGAVGGHVGRGRAGARLRRG
jgi:hypothetical protein